MSGRTWTNRTRFRRAILRHYRLNARAFPWRTSRDPYAVLIGEVLLQRTRGENAARPYEEFIARWPTPNALATATREEIDGVIRPLGLSRRAAQLEALGGALGALGEVPTNPEALARLPGVGPYAAHAVPVFAAGSNLAVVDWVIARVLRRYFGLPAILRPNGDVALWQEAARLARPGRARDLWLGTLDFAAAICSPRPKCGRCPLNVHCAYYLGDGAA